ncbi:Apoptosis-associated speck-like protein containing a CARD [Oryzias melastigma]|uniref:Apoptosis-associated speck-like protein containing a CARD n=1 Tax=Oryzias melastigma TaxID=30732 RepID=A0A834C6B3_ORYME|nr:Apoptosis-associated speck-like protein containing a CARD [Oryzias melastigma]
MAAKKALKKCLQKLSSKEFKEFTDSLLDREGEPRVYKNQIEGKDYMEVTNVMVNVFSEKNVLSVAAEVLRDANLGGFADELAVAAPTSAPAAVRVEPAPEPVVPEKHFVDKFRAELIEEVTFMEALFKALLNEGVISPERDRSIKALPTRRKKLSALLSEDLQDQSKKNVFLSVLREQHRDLVSRLERS